MPSNDEPGDGIQYEPPYISGYEFGFRCDCDSADTGKTHTELDRRIEDGDTVECEHCGATWRVDFERADDAE